MEPEYKLMSEPTPNPQSPETDSAQAAETAPAKPLRRRCLKCGYTFLGKVFETPDFDVCPKCEYNLTGNVSGRCPECGWKLPRRFRAYRRLADRALRGATPRPQGPTANQAQRNAPTADTSENRRGTD